MSYRSRNAVIFLVFILVVVFGVQPLRSWWVGEYIANRSFVSSLAWFAPTYALIWLFELLWSAVAGFLLALAFRNGRPVAWALILGAFGGIYHFAFTSIHIGADAPWMYTLWIYGEYFVPLVGAVTGAWLGCRLFSRSAPTAP
jgi:hypothetical protein